MEIAKKGHYIQLVSDIGRMLEEGRRRALQSVNAIIVQTYWQIGKRIADFEDTSGKSYGSKLFEQIAKDLRRKYGKGFSRSNIVYMRLLYRLYPKSQTLSDQLSWSHYVGLLGITCDFERKFYESECIQERWGVRDLRRQIETGLFYRLPAGTKHRALLQLSQRGHIVKKAGDIVKDQYVFEFLGLSEPYSEKQLEDKIINNLQMFLLELGKGFSFAARQFKMTISHKHFYADMVFYHSILRCYVVIDLKTGSLAPRDVGQMNLYLNYFKENVNKAGDTAPIGIIMAKDKGFVEVKYALGGMSSRNYKL